MKKNQFSPRRAISALAFVALAALTLASCAVDGYDDESFSGGVSGQTLNSPAADSIVFTANADGSKTTITWPVVLGASGYRCSVYNVNDEQNPVAIIADTLVDGTSLVVPRSEDTNYSFSIQTIGNAQLNNADAANATVASFSSYLPGFATIPDGADIAEWLSQNAIPEDSGEIALDLVPGGPMRSSATLLLPSVLPVRTVPPSPLARTPASLSKQDSALRTLSSTLQLAPIRSSL